MKAGDTIYVVTRGSIDDDDELIGVHSTHRGAITFCTDAASAAADDCNEDDPSTWMATTDLDTHATLRMSPALSDEVHDMCWWNIEKVVLKQ